MGESPWKFESSRPHQFLGKRECPGDILPKNSRAQARGTLSSHQSRSRSQLSMGDIFPKNSRAQAMGTLQRLQFFEHGFASTQKRVRPGTWGGEGRPGRADAGGRCAGLSLWRENCPASRKFRIAAIIAAWTSEREDMIVIDWISDTQAITVPAESQCFARFSGPARRANWQHAARGGPTAPDRWRP